ncbi:MAG: transposase [Deltaproteobacteria bacterium]|nr:MAG: transposase [Deltaproteobacteria bacterium]
MLHNKGVVGMAGTRGVYTDLNDAQWAIVAPLLPAAKPGGRPRTTCMQSVLDGVLHLLRTGCQWRLLPRCFPPWSTVHHYFRLWQ